MNQPTNPTKRRVLVIANETATDEKLHETLRSVAASADVLVISPAFNSRIRHWLSDEDGTPLDESDLCVLPQVHREQFSLRRALLSSAAHMLDGRCSGKRGKPSSGIDSHGAAYATY